MATIASASTSPPTNSSAARSGIASHIQALQTKHAGLEERLHHEQTRPAPDAAMIQDIKKQKLRLKEEIARG